MDAKRFGLIYKVLSTSYEWFDAEDSYKIKLWYTLLQDIDEDLLSDTVLQRIKTNSKPPTIADLRITAIRRIVQLPSADVAWLRVMDLINKKLKGSDLTDETWLSIKAVGGTWAINNSDTAYIQNEFKKSYRGFVDFKIKDLSVNGLPKDKMLEYSQQKRLEGEK